MSDEVLLNAIHDSLKHRSASARSTAALLDNPSCGRRAVLDAARVDLADVAARLGSAPQFGQSPFALGQGNRFEQRLKENEYEALIAAVDEVIGIFAGVEEIRTANLERVPMAEGQRLIEARADATAKVLVDIATGAVDAPHVVDHGVTTLAVGGSLVYLEQDALAFREGQRLRICEVKGFPIIDGSASPTKVGAAARQTAVYVASIQDTLEARGFDPSMLSTEVILICPRNFSIRPTGVRIDVSREVRALRRQLRRRASIAELVEELESAAAADGIDLYRVIDVIAAGSAESPSALGELIDALPYRYAPECLNDCDLARHCRRCATQADSPARLGGEAVALVGEVPTIADAIALAEAQTGPEGSEEVASILQGARRAIVDLGAAS